MITYSKDEKIQNLFNRSTNAAVSMFNGTFPYQSGTFGNEIVTVKPYNEGVLFIFCKKYGAIYIPTQNDLVKQYENIKASISVALDIRSCDRMVYLLNKYFHEK